MMITINTFLLAFLFILTAGFTLELGLEWTNARYMKKSAGRIPPALQDRVDQDQLRKTVDYNLDHTKTAVFYGMFNKIIFLFIILSGILPWLANRIENMHFIAAGLVFFAFPALIESIVHVPFDYYQIFVIEERYGFNTRNRKVWVADLLKSLLIGAIIGGLLLGFVLLIIRKGGSLWWLWSWLVFLAFQFIMIILYPKIIAPFFNKFTPIENQSLVEKIKDLATPEGIKVEGIFQMDAGKRSRHTNAYFTGFGKTKRIVLFDTLLASHTDDEIIAVLAHEMGHLKKRHMLIQFGGIGLTSFILFFLVARMLEWIPMYASFGFHGTPAYVGLFLTSILWSPFGIIMAPFFLKVIRKLEKAADRYAYTLLKTANPLVQALKKMVVDNLSNINPHPLYVIFHYSHPAILDRIAYLERWDRKEENED
ncbi:MAG: M48 family peptidase [Desulfobacteraceae bacterium]|nr:MAG: M48 family peptidase [Desulfobacteraceae bacterium]